MKLLNSVSMSVTSLIVSVMLLGPIAMEIDRTLEVPLDDDHGVDEAVWPWHGSQEPAPRDLRGLSRCRACRTGDSHARPGCIGLLGVERRR